MKSISSDLVVPGSFMSKELVLTIEARLSAGPIFSAIGLGSNLGDSEAILEAAVETLEGRSDIRLTARSHWYETKPVLPSESQTIPQRNYLNGCILAEVQLTPWDLLNTLLAIEAQFGRVRRERWQPRTLDLDLLLYNHLILNTPPLCLPHPRMNERAFVLVPLAEIAPDWIDPISGKAIGDLVQTVDCSEVRVKNVRHV